MRKILVAAVAVAAFGAVACSDSPTAVSSMGPSLDHQTGDPANAVFDLSDPILSGDVSGGDVQLSWTSEDNYFDLNFHNALGWEHELDRWKFEIYRKSAGEDEFSKIFDVWYHDWEGGSPTCEWNDAQLECEFTDVDPGEGSHAYYVKAVAREGTPQGGQENFTIHHSHRSNEVEVTVGAGVVYTVEVLNISGGGQTPEFSNEDGTILFSKSGDFTFNVALFGNGERIEDCSVLGSQVKATIRFEDPTGLDPAEATAELSDEDCAYQGGNPALGWRYHVKLPNLNNNEESSGTISFEIDGVLTETGFAFTTK